MRCQQAPVRAHPASTTSARTARLRTLNDALRIDGRGGLVVPTRGVLALGHDAVAALLSALRMQEVASADPDDVHAAGQLRWRGHDITWSIACYDHALREASPDPCDPAVTVRVLTVKLAAEEMPLW